jgi:ATP-binding cassette subfamily B (MDR/TAP) protein 1
MNLLTYHLQAGKLVQLSSAFFGGFVIAFTRGWLLTLVMLTSLPLVAIAGAVSAHFLTKVSSKKLTSYGNVGDLVEQTIGAIRTVSSNYSNYFKVYQLLSKKLS